MQTYTTLDGTVLDLTDASDEERGYFDRCIMAYRAGMAWEDFTMLAGGLANPLIRATDGLITRAIYDTPLYQAVRDLEDRLGIQQECLASDPTDDVVSDPLDDEWLSVAESASAKGVTVPGLHKAIRRGSVIARPAGGNGTRLVVSRNSLARWTPSAARQAARRQQPSPA